MKKTRLFKLSLVITVILVTATALFVTSCTHGSSEGESNPPDTIPIVESNTPESEDTEPAETPLEVPPTVVGVKSPPLNFLTLKSMRP